MASYSEKDKEGYNKYLSDRERIMEGSNIITWDAVSFEEYCKWKQNPREYIQKHMNIAKNEIL